MLKMFKVHFFIICLFAVNLNAQTISFTNVETDTSNITISVLLESDILIKIKEDDIAEINNEFITPFGIPVRNYSCVYVELEDETYQLILTNWIFDEVYEYFEYYQPTHIQDPLYIVEFVGKKNFDIIVPRIFNDSTDVKIISSIKILFFFNRDRRNYQIVKNEIDCNIVVYDDRKIYWTNDRRPMER